MEIERKFLVREIPDLSGIDPVRYERYYINRSPELEERIQKKGVSYEYERKEKISALERTREKRALTLDGFEVLKHQAKGPIIRDSYRIDGTPGLSIKIYHGLYEGLTRAEVEFDSREAAEVYIPLGWMGREITNTPLGRDSQLLDLSPEVFLHLLNSLE